MGSGAPLPSSLHPSELVLASADERGSAAVSAAPGTRSTYLEPWIPRVRDIDEATLDGLVRTLVQLRRIKFGLTGVGFVGGAFVFGVLPLQSWVHMALIYGTLSLLVGMPVMATSTLAVRRLFLKEGQRQGLSRSAAMLVLTRAERQARHLRPFLSFEAKVERLKEAVRDWDRA